MNKNNFYSKIVTVVQDSGKHFVDDYSQVEPLINIKIEAGKAYLIVEDNNGKKYILGESRK